MGQALNSGLVRVFKHFLVAMRLVLETAQILAIVTWKFAQVQNFPMGVRFAYTWFEELKAYGKIGVSGLSAPQLAALDPKSGHEDVAAWAHVWASLLRLKIASHLIVQVRGN